MPRQESDDAVPIRDLVERAESRLLELQRRKNHIRRRIQALRYLANFSASRRKDQNLFDTSPSQLSGTNSSRQNLSPTAATSPLRRACRIALMESDVPQTCQEVFERIKKRGSFSFNRPEAPDQVLVPELAQMVRDSEAASDVLSGETRWRWRRE